MKRLLALIPVLMLFGCSRIANDVQTRLNIKLTEAAETEISFRNYSKDYYSYYIQPYVGRVNADETSNTFVLNGNKFVMNLNIVSVISKADRDTFLLGKDMLDEANVIASSEGMYTSADDVEYPYSLRICRAGSSCAVLMHAAYFDLCGFCDENEAPDLAAEMMRIVRSTKVNADAVLAEYTYDKAISYTGKPVKLFEDIAPESGSIEELFPDSVSGGNGIGDYTDDSQEYHTQIETDEAPAEEDTGSEE